MPFSRAALALALLIPMPLIAQQLAPADKLDPAVRAAIDANQSRSVILLGSNQLLAEVRLPLQHGQFSAGEPTRRFEQCLGAHVPEQRSVRPVCHHP